MITLSGYTDWNTARNTPGVKFEYELRVNGQWLSNLTGCNPFKLSQNIQLFQGTPSVGNAIAGELDTEVIIPSSITVPRMAKVEPFMRYVLPDGTVSSWQQSGTYYIDTREKTGKNNKYTIHAYDAMLMLEQPYISSYSSGTRADRFVVQEIANQLSGKVSTAIQVPWANSQSYQVPFLAGTYTMREVLGYIAASHMCNVYINGATNQIRMVSIKGYDMETYGGGYDIGKQCRSLELGEPITYSGVEVIIDNEQGYHSGDLTGEVFKLECPWATQTMADNCMSVLSGWTYYPYHATGAFIHPFIHLGDRLTMQDENGNTITSIIDAYSTNSTSSFTADLGADFEKEIDHEYTYESKAKREWTRELATTKTTFAVETQAIRGEVDKITEQSGIHDNILPYPFYETTKTSNGLTITDNGDGSLTVNGTSTGSVYFYLEHYSKYQLPVGTYTISGGTSDALLYVSKYDGGWSTTIVYDSGTGKTFTQTLPQPQISIYYYIAKNKTFDNVTLYPMLTGTDKVTAWKSPVYTQHSSIQINAGAIESKVSLTDFTGNNIASIINQTATTIQISASKINLNGYVTLTNLQTSGQTTINGANITTGNITIGGSTGNVNGGIYIYDANDSLLVRLDKNGLYLGENQHISCSKLYGGTLQLGGPSGTYGHMDVLNASNKLCNRLDEGGLAFYQDGTKVCSINSSNYASTFKNGFAIELNVGSGYVDYMMFTKAKGITMWHPTGSASQSEALSLHPVNGLVMTSTNSQAMLKGTELTLNTSGSSTYRATLTPNNGLSLYDANGKRRMLLNINQLVFYDANGNITKTYPAT